MSDPVLNVRQFEGRVGEKRHVTQREEGEMPTAALANLNGVMGERPNEHRTMHGETWNAFADDVKTNGVQRPIFITVDHDDEPRISEGNHRRDAAVLGGLPTVPVEISYFGHAEQQGSVLDRWKKR